MRARRAEPVELHLKMYCGACRLHATIAVCMLALGSPSRRRRTAILAALLAGCVLAALAATASAAVSASASGLDLAAIAVAPADLQSGKVSKQRYVKAAAIVLSSYEREFAPGADIGHGLTLLLVNDLDELATAAEAHRYYTSNRAFIASTQGGRRSRPRSSRSSRTRSRGAPPRSRSPACSRSRRAMRHSCRR